MSVTPSARLGEATQAHAAGDFDGARRLALQALRGCDDESVVARALELLLKVDEPERVLPIARKHARLLPAALVLVALGHVELAAGDVPRARKSFERARSCSVAGTEAHAEASARVDGLATAGRLTARSPQPPVRRVAIPSVGDVPVPLARDVALPSAIVPAWSEDAGDAAHLCLVHERAAAGDVEGAYRLTLDLPSLRRNALDHAAQLAFALGDDDAACAHHRRLGSFTADRESQVIAFAVAGAFDEALELVDAARATSSCRGVVHFLRGAWDEAFRDLSYGVESRPTAELFTLLGWAGVARGQRPAAREAFEKVLGALPRDRRLRQVVEASAALGLSHLDAR